MSKNKKLPPKLKEWVDARKKFRLSHAQIQMARELGMNPTKLGSLANHRQEKWKVPLPRFIADLYFERFAKERPDEVLPVEELFMRKRQKTNEEDARGETHPEERSDDPF